MARKWDYSRHQANEGNQGRPTISTEVEALVVQFAKDNPGWGYDRSAGALANLGHTVSDQSVGNILERHSIGKTPERKRGLTWAEFVRRHKNGLWATDFFTAEIWTRAGLTTFYVLFFIHIHTRRVVLGGITRNPDQAWMKQIARNVTGEDGGIQNARYLIHDRDGKYCPGFDLVFESAGIEPLKLPPQSPNLNAFAERWVRSVKEECLDQLILFGERSLRHALNEYVAHYHQERNHQGLDNVIPFPDKRAGPSPEKSGYVHPRGPKTGKVIKSERLGGLLKFYYRLAA